MRTLLLLRFSSNSARLTVSAVEASRASISASAGTGWAWRAGSQCEAVHYARAMTCKGATADLDARWPGVSERAMEQDGSEYSCSRAEQGQHPAHAYLQPPSRTPNHLLHPQSLDGLARRRVSSVLQRVQGDGLTKDC